MAVPTESQQTTRTYYPREQRVRQYITRTLEEALERFGYEAYEVPAQGAPLRAVGAMVAAKRQQLAYPLRWYSWTDMRGTASLFGVADRAAETELLQLAVSMLKAVGAKSGAYGIRLSSRKLVSFIQTEYLGLTSVQRQTIARLMRQLGTMPHEAFVAELDAVCTPSQREAGVSNKLLGLLRIDTLQHLPEVVRQHSAVSELHAFLQALHAVRIEHVQFDLATMWAEDEYDGMVFEVYDAHRPQAVFFSGGRGNQLIASLGAEPLPLVSLSIDVVALQAFLHRHNLLPEPRSTTDMCVIIPGTLTVATQRVVDELRETEVNVVVELSQGNEPELLKAAARRYIPYVMFVDEVAAGEEQFTLVNVSTGASERHGIARIVSIVKDYRTKD